MLPHGSDRVRASGDKLIVHSNISKGWKARTPKQLTQAEHPGTTVFWDDEYFEVLSAELIEGGGVRYVLAAWREDHVIRTFVRYDEESEAALAADYALAQKQRRQSMLSRFIGVFLGHLPAPVQNHLANELGVSPVNMTLVSCIPSILLLGGCVFIYVDARIAQKPSPVALWLWFVAILLFFETGVRYYVAMSQSRGTGSLLGTIVYAIYYQLASPKRRATMASPYSERGDRLFMLPPPDDVALQDAITLRAPLLTLLSPAEQTMLGQRYGFDYRRHAFGITWMILVMSAIGVVSSWSRIQDGRGSTAVISLSVAALLSLEQVLRLMTLRHGPAGSVLGIFVRPFARKLLR